MATMAEYAGEYCKNLGLTIDELYRASTHPPTMKIANIKKGPIYELSQIRKSRGTSWIKFYASVKSVCDSSFTTPFNSFKVMVGRLDKKRCELLRNKKKHELQALFDEPFCGVHIVLPTPTEDTALSKEKAKVEELSAKLQTLSIRNVNKRIKRRDVKLAQSQAQVKEMEREQKAQDKTIKKLETRLQCAQSSVHCLRQRIYRSKHKNEDGVDSMSQENSELRAQLDDIEEAFSSKVAELEERRRRICHKWREPDGSEHLYYGKILSLVPGTTDWFNVIYDGEDTVLSLNLFIDIERGDLNFVD